MADYNYRTLLTEKKDRILTITLNRPEVLNAVGDGMHDELEDIFNDHEVVSVVLTGAGRGFCSGGDISSMESQWHFREGRRHRHRLAEQRLPAYSGTVNSA